MNRTILIVSLVFSFQSLSFPHTGEAAKVSKKKAAQKRAVSKKKITSRKKLSEDDKSRLADRSAKSKPLKNSETEELLNEAASIHSQIASSVANKDFDPGKEKKREIRNLSDTELQKEIESLPKSISKNEAWVARLQAEQDNGTFKPRPEEPWDDGKAWLSMEKLRLGRKKATLSYAESVQAQRQHIVAFDLVFPPDLDYSKISKIELHKMKQAASEQKNWGRNREFGKKKKAVLAKINDALAAAN